jgi:hypothetical protein
MSLTKSILESRTVWANLIGLAHWPPARSALTAGVVDQGAWSMPSLKRFAGASFVASTLFRIKATRQILNGDAGGHS